MRWKPDCCDCHCLLSVSQGKRCGWLVEGGAADAQLMHVDLNPMCPKYDIGEKETPIVSWKTHVALKSLHAVVVWMSTLV